MSRPSAKVYELAVLEKIRLDFAGTAAKVCGTDDGKVHRIKGRYSLAKRQVDVAVYRPESSLPFLMIDAKRHNRKLNVKDIESFIGMLEDVDADRGVLVSPQDITSAAKRRLSSISAKAEIMSEEEALTNRWLKEARERYPYDWVFHKKLAYVARLCYENASDEEIIEALEGIAFEEWLSVVDYTIMQYPKKAQSLLSLIAREHPDSGWRFNAIDRLADGGMMDNTLLDELIAQEGDAETLELLDSLASHD